jgi:hypothetical protein
MPQDMAMPEIVRETNFVYVNICVVMAGYITNLCYSPIPPACDIVYVICFKIYDMHIEQAEFVYLEGLWLVHMASMMVHMLT